MTAPLQTAASDIRDPSRGAVPAVSETRLSFSRARHGRPTHPVIFLRFLVDAMLFLGANRCSLVLNPRPFHFVMMDAVLPGWGSLVPAEVPQPGGSPNITPLSRPVIPRYRFAPNLLPWVGGRVSVRFACGSRSSRFNALRCKGIESQAFAAGREFLSSKAVLPHRTYCGSAGCGALAFAGQLSSGRKALLRKSALRALSRSNPAPLSASSLRAVGRSTPLHQTPWERRFAFDHSPQPPPFRSNREPV